jgi:RimJ/RimL family protein N-acetyltransferase
MLIGEKINLVAFEQGHALKTLDWLNDAEICRLLGRTAPISTLEQINWFDKLTNHRGELVYFAVETSHEHVHIGNVWLHGIDRQNSKAEVRIVLDPSQGGKGFGVEALKLIKKYGFDWLNLHKLTSFVYSFNLPAQKAFEKAGYSKEATLIDERWSNGKYVDLLVYSCIRGRQL